MAGERYVELNKYQVELLIADLELIARTMKKKRVAETERLLAERIATKWVMRFRDSVVTED